MVMRDLVEVNPEIMGGTPVFKGTRVPIQTLFDYLEGKETIETFTEDFPSVPRKQAIELLEALKHQALQSLKAA